MILTVFSITVVSLFGLVVFSPMISNRHRVRRIDKLAVDQDGRLKHEVVGRTLIIEPTQGHSFPRMEILPRKRSSGISRIPQHSTYHGNFDSQYSVRTNDLRNLCLLTAKTRRTILCLPDFELREGVIRVTGPLPNYDVQFAFKLARFFMDQDVFAAAKENISDQNDNFGTLSLRVLAQEFGDLPETQALAQRALQHSSSHRRVAAAEVLGTAALSTLKEIIENKEPALPAALHLFAELDIPGLCDLLEGMRLRKKAHLLAAINALGSQPGPGPLQTIGVLADRTYDEEVRLTAIQAIQRIDLPDGLQQAVAIARITNSSEVLHLALDMAAKWGDRTTVTALYPLRETLQRRDDLKVLNKTIDIIQNGLGDVERGMLSINSDSKTGGLSLETQGHLSIEQEC